MSESGPTILVTGANGFVGRAVTRELLRRDLRVRAVVRTVDAACDHANEVVTIASIDSNTDWREALGGGVDTVIHLAARVHVMREELADPLAEFRKVNVQGTLRLAQQAAKAGVRRFVFLSSIKVNGETTDIGKLFTADDSPAPQDAYAISKWEAEQGLWEIAANTGMEVVVIRPPLVYGAGVKANFQRMMHWLALGVPLPFGAVTENRRSLLAMGNLVDLVMLCLHHPAAANQTYLASDGEDLSTAELLRRLGLSLARPVRLWRLPTAWLKFGFTVIGKSDIYLRLCGSLQIDISKTQRMLGWVPPVSVDEALRQSAEAWLSERIK